MSDKTKPSVANALDAANIEKNMSNIEYVYNSHVKSGLLHRQAVALIGNYVVESGVDPYSKQKGGGTGKGIMQVTDSARTRRYDAYRPTPIFDGTDLELQRQARYVEDHINTRTPGEWRHTDDGEFTKALSARNAFNKEEDVARLTEIVSKAYLRPSKPHTDRRIDAANYLDTYFKNKNIKPIETSIPHGNVSEKGFVRPSDVLQQYLGGVDQYPYGGTPTMEALDIGAAAMEGVSGALAGAAGGMVAGPIGMGVGAAIGAVGGFISGLFNADAARKEKYEKAKAQFNKQIEIEEERAEKIKEEYAVTDSPTEGRGYYAALGMKSLPTRAFTANKSIGIQLSN